VSAYLERHDPARNMARFYTVKLSPTLFGEWALVREWGRIGSPGTVREEWFPSGIEAEGALSRALKQKQSRGYRMRT